MASGKKTNADFFKHDSDMRNNIKVRALRRRFSHLGYAAWCYFLEVLTDADGFQIEYNDLTKELIAGDFDVTSEELDDIVAYCQKLGLLKVSDMRLYSPSLITRFEAIIEGRERKSEIARKKANARWECNSNATASKKEEKECNSNATASKSGAEKCKEVEVEVEVEGEKKRDKLSKKPEAVVSLWNSTLGDLLPKVAVLSEGRRQQISARLSELSSDSDEALQQIQALFDKVRASRFLLGGNDRNWTITIDWLFNSSENIAKVLEGNYDDKRGIRSQAKHLGITLGADERIETDGRRTYGTGVATVPPDAPPRPSARHQWDANALRWMFI